MEGSGTVVVYHGAEVALDCLSDAWRTRVVRHLSILADDNVDVIIRMLLIFGLNLYRRLPELTPNCT